MLTDEEVRENIAAHMPGFRGEMSRYALAKLVGVATIQISRIEEGKHTPGAGMLARIAEALDVTTDDLLYGPQKKSHKRA